ncbi:hypothetical protein BZG36_01505 [Bifiguratus adelaidae]|uniref:tRNA (guanine(26)-N(2))-dimethyltransferase n=1 Tax=Bifiguratus adelaidae TaxID=1938954 RepID=A0A261Y4R3_9FUNG|nr:hypothetical protein BZG36_01505 [Bifiguratus adelaidae]
MADLTHYNVFEEGKAKFLMPKKNKVFYNNVQQFNRDMSIAAIKTWHHIWSEEKRQAQLKRIKNKAGKEAQGKASVEISDGSTKAMEVDAQPVTSDKPTSSSVAHNKSYTFTILEALAASGIRSLRYALEIPHISKITSNDLLEDAVEAIKQNVEYNGIRQDLMVPNLGDAIDVMYSHRDPKKRFDVIDIDPYGTAVPFLDGAVQAVADGGLLCITCTDMAILTGSMHPETCYYKYGAMPVKGMFHHEMGLRILLQTIANTAAKYSRVITPMLSCSIDFYCRVFVRVHTSAADAKLNALKMSHVYQCTRCFSFATQPVGRIVTSAKGGSRHTPNTGPVVGTKCEHCGGSHHVGGPFWNASLHDNEFVQVMKKEVKDNGTAYGTERRMEGMLSVISEELNVPFYWTLGRLTSRMQCTSIPMTTVFSALLNGGYKASVSHCAADSVKTDAPASVMWDILRAWVKEHPIKQENIRDDSVAKAILDVSPQFQADFTYHKDAESESRKQKLVRFQMNPEKNWGPKARPSSKRSSDDDEEADKKQKTE